MIDLDRVIDAATALPPLPESALRLARLLAEEDWELAQVADVVRLDPPLCGRALGLANSASLGYRHPTVDAHQAVMRLGPGSVLGLAIGSGARRSMDGAVPWLGLGPGELWRHSVASALAVELMPSVLKRRVPAEAFAAALLHDVGKVVLAPHVGERDAGFVRRARSEGRRAPWDAEREILETTHAEVGALVVSRWGLPAAIVDGVAHHHAPDAAAGDAGRAVAEVVALADRIAARVCADDADPAGDAADALDPALEPLIDRLRARLDEVLAAYA